MALSRHFLGIVLPVGTIVAFTLLLVLSLFQLSTVERDMRIEATQNMLWVISRAQSATLRLSEGAAQHALDLVEAQDVRRRLDIWFCTMGVLGQGPQQRQIEALGFAADFDGLQDTGAALESAVEGLIAGDEAQLGVIYSTLSPLETALARAANGAMVAEWDELGARLDATRIEMRQIGVSLMAIAAAGLVLVVYLIVMARASHRRSSLLERERAFSQLLVTSSGKGIAAIDLEGRCTLWNETMETLFGVTAVQAQDRELRELSGLFDIERIRHAIAAARSGQSRTILDQPLFDARADRLASIDIEIFPLRERSAIVGAVLLISDVTERHDAQRELARHRDHLEQEVARRTSELDAALMRERAALDIYRNFASMISHQFRTPLAIVDSSLQRLMRRGAALSPDELAERGAKARAAIARLVSLVESTLDAARLDAGQVEIRKHPCDIEAMVRDIFAREAGGRRLRLAPPQSAMPPAYGDPVQVEHILLNLMSNASKYAPDGTPIDVEIVAGTDAIRCRVSNEGHIPPAEREHLFERYFRGENSRHASGIGIGLYIARSLARLQGGDVHLIGKDDGKVTLEFILPLAPLADGATGEQPLEARA